MRRFRQFENRGFTLIELLGVLSIVVLIMSISISTVQSIRARGRDNQRKKEITSLKVYLELYKDQNGKYPTTGGSSNWYSSDPNDKDTRVDVDHTDNWIPNLVPGYVPVLPKDPLGGRGVGTDCTGAWKRAYLYVSDGDDYILMAHCGVERTISSSDLLYNSAYPTSFVSCTPAACNNWSF